MIPKAAEKFIEKSLSVKPPLLIKESEFMAESENENDNVANRPSPWRILEAVSALKYTLRYYHLRT